MSNNKFQLDLKFYKYDVPISWTSLTYLLVYYLESVASIELELYGVPILSYNIDLPR